jgi:hypothetical protein
MASSDNTTNAIEADTHLNDDDDIYDETPTFIDMNSAVEVDVPDDNIDGIDDDDDVMMDDDEENNNEDSPSEPVIDQSKLTFSSHTDAVYAIASHYDSASKTLSIVSGGGEKTDINDQNGQNKKSHFNYK